MVIKMEAFIPIDVTSQVALEVQVPEPRVFMLETLDNYGRFSCEPLERGYAITIGNPIRRVLLNSIPGIAITWIRVEGMLQEYSSMPHLKEDIMEILQRVKQIRLKPITERREGRMRLVANGPGEIYASDIEVPADFEITNTDLLIATLDSPKGHLDIEFNVESGTGYTPASSDSGLAIGTMSVDAIFTPVRRVNFTVERTRVGQFTDYERLILEIWTDGTITPDEALKQASLTFSHHLSLFTNVGTVDAVVVQQIDTLVPSDIANMGIERLELSSRTQNSLRRAGMQTVGDILERTRIDLMNVRNFGERSFNELIECFHEKQYMFPGTTLANSFKLAIDEDFDEDSK
jgi:DNA-directed RNA polymerase subunit alpha